MLYYNIAVLAPVDRVIFHWYDSEIKLIFIMALLSSTVNPAADPRAILDLRFLETYIN